MDELTKRSKDGSPTGTDTDTGTGTGVDRERMKTKKQRTDQDQQDTVNATATTTTTTLVDSIDTGSRTVNENNNNILINNEEVNDDVSDERGKYKCYHEKKKKTITQEQCVNSNPSFFIYIFYVCFGVR
jgi:hypothetical protein